MLGNGNRMLSGSGPGPAWQPGAEATNWPMCSEDALASILKRELSRESLNFILCQKTKSSGYGEAKFPHGSNQQVLRGCCTLESAGRLHLGHSPHPSLLPTLTCFTPCCYLPGL